MKNKIKLIAIDFDGTFLDDKHFKSDLSYVDKIRKANISQEIVFASGRATAGILELVEKLGMEDMVRYIIGHNGAEIYDLKNNKVIYQVKMDDEVLFNILELVKNEDAPIGIHKWKELYVYNYDNRVDLENVLNFTTSYKISNIKEFENSDKLKIMIFTTNEDINRIYDNINTTYPGLVNQARSADELIEITAKGISKASALLHLTKILGIKLEEVLAFGNAENDLEMIEEVGYGFAMKNSAKVLLDVAKNVTKYTNNEFGVEKEIIDILEIK